MSEPSVGREPLIRLEHVSRRYVRGVDEVHALEDCSLEVSQGRFAAFMGPSGSGKSTLLNLVSGIDRPSDGRVFVSGQLLNELDEDELAAWRARHVGLIFQFFNLIPSLTVEMNVALPLLLDGKRLPTLRPRIHEILDILGIGHRRGHAPHQLSGGEMQRVAIARALIVQPRLILADEPTGNLDTKTAHEVFHLLRAQVDQRGVTMVVLTHDPDASTYADRVIEMRDGRILQDSGPIRSTGRGLLSA